MGLPSGTVTFVFTDIEGSTGLAQSLGDEVWADLLAVHHTVVRDAVVEAGGQEVRADGDGFVAVFTEVVAAVRAALVAQRRLESRAWPKDGRVRVRMGIHTGEALLRDGDYVGYEVHRASRIADAGHGGQVLVSQPVAAIVDDRLPAGARLEPLGPHRLRGLGAPQRLFQLSVEGLQTQFPPLRCQTWLPNTLPIRRTGLIGRERQVTRVRDLLHEHSLVTLTGVGGAGKTRLALQVASDEQERFSGGVYFVDLTRCTDEGEVAAAALEAMQRSRSSAPSGSTGTAEVLLLDALRDRQALLVLDNCEHVVEAGADLVGRLLASCPELWVLATSRVALGVGEEYVHRVPPLELEAAVALFDQRAAAVTTVADVGPGGRERIREICTRLDGLPLAIELAAARCSHMTVDTIAEHLDERFWLLATGRGRPGRHQTLRATLDWSYDLLDEQDRRLLRASSVFVGSFDAVALAAVVGISEREAYDRIGSLVANSLVEQAPGPASSRYRLLESVRAYARQRLEDAGETARRRQAHARYVVARATQHPPRVTGISWGVADPVLGDELSDLVAALDWLESHGELADVGVLAARVPTVLGHRTWVDPGRRYLERDDVTRAMDDPEERALYLMASAANAAMLGGRFDEQAMHGQAALDEARDPLTRANAAVYTSIALLALDPQRIPALVDDVLEQLPDGELGRRVAMYLRGQRALGLVAQWQLEQAAVLLDELAEQGLGQAAGEAMLVHHLLGDDARALAVPLPSSIDPLDAGWDHRWPLVRVLVAATRGRIGEAVRHLRAAAEEVRTSSLGLVTQDVLLGAVAIAHHQGNTERASHLLAVVRGGVDRPAGGANTRSPAAAVVYAHYLRAIKPHLPREERRAVLEEATGRDPGAVLEAELARLEAGGDH